MLALDEGGWSVSCPHCFTLGKRPWYPLDRMLGGPQNRSRHEVNENKSLPLPGIELWSSSPTGLFTHYLCDVESTLAFI